VDWTQVSDLASGEIAQQVSIVVPTYNRIAFLRDAVDSVLAQTYQDWELILVDDGSGAEMTSYLAGWSQTPRIKVLRLSHSGNPSVVRNAGIRAASGAFVAFLDSDDVWLPTKLERQISLHQSHPERRWSYVAMERIHADGTLMQGQPVFPTPDGAIFEQLLTLKADVSMSSLMAERELLEGIGCFDESQRYFEDYDLFTRLSLHSDASVVTQPLVRMRDHSEHYSGNQVAMYEGRAQLLEKLQPIAERKGLGGVVRRERIRNGADLARTLAARGRRREALQLLWRIRLTALHERKWWRACAVTLKSFAPAWVRTAYRRAR
jgi:glycosyltransferase involved in cell wall biosynthesis